MLPTVASLAGIASALLLGARPSRLFDVRFRWPWLAFLPFLVQVVGLGVLDLQGDVAALVHAGSYAPMAVFVIANRAIPGLPLVVVGLVLNAAAIIANGGVMPADPDALRRAGIEIDGGFSNSAPVEDPKLAWLGDVFALPEPLPFANVFSIGDVVLVLGVTVFAHVQGRSILWHAVQRRRRQPSDLAV